MKKDYYIPILKGKDGEFFAMSQLHNETRVGTSPLIELLPFEPPPPVDPAAKKRKSRKPDNFDAFVRKQAKSIADSTVGMPRVYIDVKYWSLNLSSYGWDYVRTLFDELYSQNVIAVPVVYCGDDPSYVKVVNEIHDVYGCGGLIRLEEQNLSVRKELSDIDMALDIDRELIDIMVDFRSTIGRTIPELHGIFRHFLDKTCYNLDTWRSVILASGAFPKNLTGIVADTEIRLERTDFLLWQDVVGSSDIRTPSFSDYSIAHPDLSGSMPVFQDVSASIRYTSENYWLVVRGRGTKKHGWEQIRAKCKLLCSMPEYDGRNFSWGDGYIFDCAAKKVGVGGSPMWRKVANNRHLEKVVDALSKLLALSA